MKAGKKWKEYAWMALWCVATLALFAIYIAMIAEAVAAEPEQAVAYNTAWQWYTSQDESTKHDTLKLMFAPGAFSVLVGMFMITSAFRFLPPMSDGLQFVVAFVMAGAIGSLVLFCTYPTINDVLGYPLFNNFLVAGAFFLTGFANHATYKVSRWGLYIAYLIGKNVPQDFAIAGFRVGWAGVVLAKFSKSLYRSLTSGDVDAKKTEPKPDPQDTDDEDDHGEITRGMMTEYVQPPDTTIPVVPPGTEHLDITGEDKTDPRGG